MRRRLAEAGVARGPRVALGTGDDAAVIDAGVSAVSVDAIVEGVHFSRETAPLDSVGRKALATALSDLAAMGAGAGEALVVLGVPADLDEAGCLRLLDGLVSGASEWSVALAGGDVVAAPVLFVSVTVLGDCDAPIRRDGARPGQTVAVTGELGGAAAGLLLLERPDLAGGLPQDTADALRRRQLEPVPRLAAGLAIAGAGATAMIDLSDGLAGDARHVASASGVSITIELERLPFEAGVAEVAEAAGRDPVELAIAGGEDYELFACLDSEPLTAAADAMSQAGAQLTEIGKVGEGPAAVHMIDAGGTPRDASGFDQLSR